MKMNNADIITQIIVAVGSIVCPLIFGYIATLVKKYIPKKAELQAIEQFAKDAVVITEQIASTHKIEDKKDYAMLELQNMLQQAGFSVEDKNILSSAIERAFLGLKNAIEAQYPPYQAPKKVVKGIPLSETTDKDGNIKPELMGR